MMKKLMRSSVALLILLVCCDAVSIGGEYLYHIMIIITYN